MEDDENVGLGCFEFLAIIGTLSIILYFLMQAMK